MAHEKGNKAITYTMEPLLKCSDASLSVDLHLILYDHWIKPLYL